MKTQDEINKAATEYGEFYGISNRSMVESAFDSGATFANGYSVEEMEKFDLWKYDNGWTYSVVRDGTYFNDGVRSSLQDLLKLWEESR